MMCQNNTSHQACPDDIRLQFELITEEDYYKVCAILSVTLAVVSIIGVLSNSLTIRTFRRMSTDKSRDMNFSFMGLAVVDLVTTLLMLVHAVTGLLYSLERGFDGVFYFIDPFVLWLYSANTVLMTTMVSTFVTVYLAVLRCLCIARPFDFKTHFTKRKCVTAFFAFITCSIILHLPYMALTETRLRFDPQVNHTRLVIWLTGDRDAIKDWCLLISYCGVSVISEIVVVICIIIMVAKLKHLGRNIRNKDQRKSPIGENIDNRLQKSPVCEHIDKYQQTLTNYETLHNKDPPVSSKYKINVINTNANPGYEQACRPTSSSNPYKLSGLEKATVHQIVAICVVFFMCNFIRVSTVFVMFIDPKVDLNRSKQFVYLTIGLVRVITDCINATVNFYIYLIFCERFRSFVCSK